MNEPVTVTYSLEEMFSRLENKIDSNQKETNEKLKDLSQKIDKQSEKIGTIEVKIATLTEKLDGIDKRLERVENSQDIVVQEVSDLKGFRSLILPIIVGGISAIIGGIVTNKKEVSRKDYQFLLSPEITLIS